MVAPPLLVVILLIANNRKVMGAEVNGPIANVLGWTAAAAMSASAAGMLWSAAAQ